MTYPTPNIISLPLILSHQDRAYLLVILSTLSGLIWYEVIGMSKDVWNFFSLIENFYWVWYSEEYLKSKFWEITGGYSNSHFSF